MRENEILRLWAEVCQEDGRKTAPSLVPYSANPAFYHSKTPIPMKNILVIAAATLLPLFCFSQSQLRLIEGPILGSKQVVKVVKQSEDEQEANLTVFLEGIPQNESLQLEASILTGGDNPMQDVNTAYVDLPPGSGNVDISFSFTPSRSYTTPYIQSRILKILIIKKGKKEGDSLDDILGESGVSLSDWTAPKYLYTLRKQWRVSPPANNPDAPSKIKVPITLIPFKSAREIKP